MLHFILAAIAVAKKEFLIQDSTKYIDRVNGMCLKSMTRTITFGLIFFNTWFTDFFLQNIKVGGGKKIKIKITKKFFLFNLKHIWIEEKNNNKNCMILHCKNAEMTNIDILFLHFYSVKSYNFCYFFFLNIFFFNLAVFYIRENKKGQKYIYFFFLMQKFGLENP